VEIWIAGPKIVMADQLIYNLCLQQWQWQDGIYFYKKALEVQIPES